MATTGKIFYNTVRGMSREELINYLSKYAETRELKVMMNCFDDLRKSCVLAEETNATVEEVNKHLNDLYVNANKGLTVGEAYLVMLEGRVKLLILSQYMAKNLNDTKRMISNRKKIAELLNEYKFVSGKRSSQSPN